MSTHKLTVIFAKTNTKVGKFLRFFTADDVNHCAVYFDDDPSVMYSYRRERRHNILSGKFGTECFLNMSRGKEMLYITSEFMLDQTQYGRIVKLLEEHKGRRYNFAAVFLMYFHIYLRNEKYFICSTFTASILKEVYELEKPYNTYTPISLRDELLRKNPNKTHTYIWTKDNTCLPAA